MKNNTRFLEIKNRKILTGFAVIFAAAIFSFSLLGCDNLSNATDSTLGGTILISAKPGGKEASAATTGDTLYAVYSGAEGVACQWSRDGAAIPGATGPGYTPSEPGAYTVTVSAAGYKSKTSAAVMVNYPALGGTILISATSGGTEAASAATTGDTLYAVYSGTEGIVYQWNRGGVAIPGETNTSYTALDAGVYTITVSMTGYQSQTSAAVMVNLPALSGTVLISATSGGTEAAVSAMTGDTLYAVYSGTESVAYQWNRDGAPLSGETGVSYTPAEAGSHTVTVSFPGHQSQISAPVTVDAPALSGTLFIVPISGGELTNAAKTGDTLCAYWDGDETIAYQWNKGGTAIPGETSDSYTPADPGEYTVTVKAGGYQSKTSAPVTVTGGGAVTNTNLVGEWEIDGEGNRFSFTNANTYVFVIEHGIGTFSGPYTYKPLTATTANVVFNITNATGFASPMIGGKYDIDIEWADSDHFTTIKVTATSPVGGPEVGEQWERVTDNDDDDDDDHKAPDKWSALVGKWKWESGSAYILLEFYAEKKTLFGFYTGPGYSFEAWSETGSSLSWGDYWFCLYDGTTLKRSDYDGTLESSWTVTLSDDGQTMAFSNYTDYEDPPGTSRLNGRTFTRQP